MLPAAHRLRKQSAFQKVYRQGVPAHAACLTLKWRQGQSRTPKIGVVVGSKVSKQAVARNLVRRRLRDISRRHLATIPGGELVVIARPGAMKSTFQQLEAEYVRTLSIVLRRRPRHQTFRA